MAPGKKPAYDNVSIKMELDFIDETNLEHPNEESRY